MTKIDDDTHSIFEEWNRLNHWHELLNAVCLDQGHQNNTELAYQFCQKQGKTSQKNTEAAARNLSNWRSGANLPSRTNLRTLTEILKISENSEFQNHWFGLYKKANQRGAYQRVEVSNTNIENRNVFVFLGDQNWKVTALLLTVFAVIIIGAFWLLTPPSLRITDQERMELNNIPWRKHVSLHVGEEAVVHGKRGNCGELPKSPEKILAALPKHLTTGILRTGELGMRTSRRCEGPTPAREIIFRGLYPGKETFFLYGDDVTVIVTE